MRLLTTAVLASVRAGYFTFWIVLAITWGLIASFICIVLPLWEAKDDLWMITV